MRTILFATIAVALLAIPASAGTAWDGAEGTTYQGDSNLGHVEITAVDEAGTVIMVVYPDGTSGFYGITFFPPPSSSCRYTYVSGLEEGDLRRGYNWQFGDEDPEHGIPAVCASGAQVITSVAMTPK